VAVAATALGEEELVARRRESRVGCGLARKTMKMHDGIGKLVAANDGVGLAAGRIADLHGPIEG
jgi:hypothetical protein